MEESYKAELRMEEVTVRGKAYQARYGEDGAISLRRFNESTGFWVTLMFSERTSTEVAEVISALGDQYARRMAG